MKIYFKNSRKSFLIYTLPMDVFRGVFILLNLLLKFEDSFIQQWLMSLLTSAEQNTLLKKICSIS